MPITPITIILGTIFLWWAATGFILLGVRMADRSDAAGAHAWLAAISSPIFGLGLWGLWTSGQSLSTDAVIGGFLSALAVWGWIELAFLSGVITGPSKKPAPPFQRGFARLKAALATILYSELLLIAISIWAIWLLWGAANPFGLWTYLVLFFARISAKLNLFLGVPNINLEFLPRPVQHLASHFKLARMNQIFPWTVTFLSFATACWLERVLAFERGSAEQTGFILLAVLTALALLEHWMMVIPMGDAKLWRWMLPKAPRDFHKNSNMQGEGK
ncbi:MAG: putative photosynthetic complex assembly protein PuhE [Pseudomonadota bacterium]